jgi:hypothetical protein
VLVCSALPVRRGEYLVRKSPRGERGKRENRGDEGEGKRSGKGGDRDEKEGNQEDQARVRGGE